MPDSIRADQLDPEALSELRTLPGDLADAVARYLVATGLEDDPERGYEYAKAARNLAARVGIVRETCAIAAYQAGHWSDALAEFRAARRLTGRDSYLPLMADCERALGRLDRALDIVTAPEARSADRATQIELRIVESGIRRDQGLPDAGVVALQIPELTDKRGRAGRARLFYAYADALLDAGREEEARDWFGKAAAADAAGETDAAERLDELDEVLIEDLDEDDVDETELEAELADEAADDEDFEDEDLADRAAGDEGVADESLRAEASDGEAVVGESLRAGASGDKGLAAGDLGEAGVDTGLLDGATSTVEPDGGSDASELNAADSGSAADADADGDAEADADGAGDVTGETSVVSEPTRAE